MSRLLLIALVALPLAAESADTGTLEITVEGVRSSAGRVLCDLHTSAETFPKHPEKAKERTTAPIVDGKAVCTFVGVPPGTYAVAAFHDENANGQLDANFLGIPREGVAVSRDAKGFFGPPSFADARFPYSGPLQRLVVHLKYL